ncbi:hypothetical protein D1007_59837 [Hordeum vulgare]|nr:hypothetical protein D1007_59837 [Hordeum vulgare]
MLDINCSQLPRDLGVRLAIWFDCDSRTVNVPNVGNFEINPFTVHQILGIPLGGRLIDKIATSEARRVIAEDTGIHSTGPSISHLMNLLSDDLTDEKFLRIFMLILLSTFLCPTSHSCASPDYFNGIVDTDDIANYDWCSFALDWLVEKIRQFQISLSKPTVKGKEQSISLGGCLMIPLVTFFDYLDLKGTKIRNCIPRLPAWDDKAISAFDNINFAQLKFRAKMKEMCTEFYKTSVDACLNALQPVLAKQMRTMVETIQNQCTMRDGVSATPLQTVTDTEFHNPSVGLALGTVESTGGGDKFHYDPNDGDVVNGLLKLRRHVGDIPFGALPADQAVVAMSSEQDFGTVDSPSAGTEVGHPESNQISAAECSRPSKRHIDLAVYIDSESESSRPLKIQKPEIQLAKTNRNVRLVMILQNRS